MIDLNLFSTQLIQTGQGSKTALSGSGTLGGQGLAIGNNLAFLDALLGGVNTDGSDDIKSGNDGSGLTQEEVAANKKADIALLQLALLGQDADKSLEDKLKELKIENLAQTKENRVNQLQKLIEHLTNGTPSTEADANLKSRIEELVTRLEQRLESLQASLESFRSGDFGKEGAPLDLLIITGMNPAELTRISNRIEEVEGKLGRPLTVEDLIAGVGNIIPAPGDEDHEFSTADALQILLNQNKTDKQIQAEEDAALKTSKQEISDELAAELNNLIATDGQAADFANNAGATLAGLQNALNNIEGNSKNPQSVDVSALLNMIASRKIAPSGIPANGLTPAGDSEGATTNPLTAIPDSLSNAEFKALFGSKVGANNNSFAAKIAQANFASQNAVPMAAQAGDFTLPASWTDTLSSTAAVSEAVGFDIQTGTPFNATMQAAHAVSSGVAASQTHPATQTVAAHINKAAANQGTSNITLHLDPPELGRVEVRLEFGHEKSVKAHLIVEKPETLLMLQRDAATLDRALQDAGLETGSDSLNYEMASEGYDFNTGQDGSGGQTGTNLEGDNTGNDEVELIETTMTWDVDPNTGHVHYSILA